MSDYGCAFDTAGTVRAALECWKENKDDAWERCKELDARIQELKDEREDVARRHREAVERVESLENRLADF